MLIEFSAENYRSLKDRQTLTMAKASGDELADTNTFRVEASNTFELLRSAAIYGPNAGGKTNLLNAMGAMKDIVVNSAKEKQSGDSLAVVPFRLCSQTLTAPSEFEIHFIVDNVRYQYGFTATASKVHEEWLFAYPKGRAQKWVERQWNEQLEDYEWSLGKQLHGEKQLWQKSTRDNALFLSTAVQLNSKQLQPIYNWFKQKLRLGGVGGWAPTYSASLCKDDNKREKQQIVEFLKAADLGIDDIFVEAKPFDTSSIPDSVGEELKEKLLKDLKGKEFLDIKTVHKTEEGETVVFDMGEDESDGTQRLFGFAGPWIDSLNNGYVIFIDELHDNLHPRLVQFLVELFHSPKTNPNNAQLIFTTHETSILNQSVFRRDQIWFCDKLDNKSSSLYPLSDFSPRKGRENLELAYLSGRYGALPFVHPFETQIKEFD